VYDLQRDPGEHDNLWPTHGDDARVEGVVRSFEEEARRQRGFLEAQGWASRPTQDMGYDEFLDQMRANGYLTGAGSGDGASAAGAAAGEGSGPSPAPAAGDGR
jgi:hypothetical protein